MSELKPTLIAPPGACDTHIHIYAPGAGPAWPCDVAAYRTLQHRLGLERAVIVQPVAYGADNSVTVNAVAALGLSTTRGIAVVEPSVSDAELDRLTQAGMRGVRFHMLPGGALPWEALEPVAARVAAFGWHVQLQMDGRFLAEREDRLKALPGNLVIDHVGKFLEPVSTSDPAFLSLLRLLQGGRTWLKLSAPYEVSKSGPPRFEDVGALAKAAVKAAPSRMLWASNWPHPSAKNPPDDAMLLDLLVDWVPEQAVRRRILVENPAELYGFTSH